MADLLQEDRGPVPVLGLFDEFAQLGTMKIMSDVMGIGRGYGLRIWPVLQDLNQLKELYPQRWETFLSNAGAQIFFAPRDVTSARYISDLTGVMEVNPVGKSVSQTVLGQNPDQGINVSWSASQQQRPALFPHEVAQLGGDKMLVFGEDVKGYILASRKSYLKTDEYKGKFSPDPYH